MGGGLFSTPLGAGTGTTGLFNQQQQQQQQQQGLGGGLFSQQATGGLFSGTNCILKCPPFYAIVCIGTGLGLGNTTVNGTTIKFEVSCENIMCFILSDTLQAPSGTDTVVLNGTNKNTATKLQCISFMKQYENYSMEVSTSCCHFEHLCKISTVYMH